MNSMALTSMTKWTKDESKICWKMKSWTPTKYKSKLSNTLNLIIINLYELLDFFAIQQHNKKLWNIIIEKVTRKAKVCLPKQKTKP